MDSGLKPLHVAIDADDVTVDFFQSVLDCFTTEYGVTPRWDGRPWGEMAVAFTTHPLFIASGYKDWWEWLRERDWLWSTFPAIPGAIGGIKQLRASGYFVECVTSKPAWAEPQLWKWIGKWRPAFQRVTIVPLGEKKVEATLADVIVDDKMETCLGFLAAGRQAVLFDRSLVPHNPGHTPGLRVARNWTEVVRHVEEIGALHGSQAKALH